MTAHSRRVCGDGCVAVGDPSGEENSGNGSGFLDRRGNARIVSVKGGIRTLAVIALCACVCVVYNRVSPL